MFERWKVKMPKDGNRVRDVEIEINGKPIIVKEMEIKMQPGEGVLVLTIPLRYVSFEVPEKEEDQS